MCTALAPPHPHTPEAPADACHTCSERARRGVAASVGADAVRGGPGGTRRNAGDIALAGNAFALLRSIDGHGGRDGRDGRNGRVTGIGKAFVAAPGVWTRELTVGRQESA